MTNSNSKIKIKFIMESIDIKTLKRTYSILERIRDEIIESVPEITRPESVEFKFDMENIELIFNLDVVGNSVIFGSKPHFPPVEPIKAWIEKKGIKGNAGPGGKLPSTSSLAFLIGRKISRTGTPAHDYYDTATGKAIEKWIEPLEEAMADDLMERMGFEKE